MNIFSSKISLNIKGKNINRFIKKLTKNKISILKLKYKDENEVDMIIYKKDYGKLKKIKSIYNITKLDVYGYIKIKQNIFKNKHLILLLTIFFIIFLFLTNLIFDIEIIHSNKDIRNLLRKELYKNGIKKYSLKKSYNDLKKIKEKILNKYPDKIEWLEIESLGTKYTVRVEERKIPNQNIDDRPRDIIAKKSGVLKKVVALKGDIVKDMDDYVNKGDLIITGQLIFNDKVTGQVKADGHVYAEIWYVIKSEYPFLVNKERYTGNKKNVYSVKFLNKNFDFTIGKYKTKKIKEKTIMKHFFLPIELTYQNWRETKITNEVLTFEEAQKKAREEAINKIKSKLKPNEYIIRSNQLKSEVNNSIVKVEMFFAVYEDITDYKEIG